MDEIFERVKEIIVEQLDVDEEKVTPEARFREDLEADSLDLVELVTAFEEAFEEELGGETIRDEDFEQITTVGKAVEYIKKRL